MHIELCRDSNEVVLSIANTGAGHNLPTGGVHRYISARVWRSSAPAQVTSLRLGREFEMGGDGTRKASRDSDHRAGSKRSLRVPLATLGGEATEPVNAEIRYHYALSDGATRIDGSSAVQTLDRRRAIAKELPTCR